MTSIYDLSARKPSDRELRRIARNPSEVSIYDPLAVQKLSQALRKFPHLFPKTEKK